MIKKIQKGSRLLLAALWLLATAAGTMQAQEAYQSLYKPDAVRKHKLRSMLVELYAVAEEQDSFQIGSGEPDYRERFIFDSLGRPSMYDATDLGLKKMGLLAPHQLSTFEYSENGRTCHRHDTTAFRSVAEWHFFSDTVAHVVKAEMIKGGEDFRSIQRSYQYDAKGRLEKVKNTRYKAGGDTFFECNSIYKVHDNLSFSATSLSPQEMALCQSTLEYYDGGKPVRRVEYDSTGNVKSGTRFSYDRTGKPIKLETLANDGRAVTATADIVYERNGVVQIFVAQTKADSNPFVGKVGISAREFVVDHWADWRLLREVRIFLEKRETSRYVFSYDIRN